MTTEKRHIYVAGTVNVETGNVAVKQDINYFSSNPQSATRSLIRMMEDTDRRFSQNQIHDGLTVSNGGGTVDVASGTAKVGGRWINVDATGLSAAVADDDYNVVLHVSGVSEINSRDPSSGETINLFLESSGSWVDDDFKLVLGSANISSSTVNSVEDRALRKVNANIILPYGTSTQVSIYTGTKPVYREAIRFTSDKIFPFNPIESNFPISGTIISGTSLSIGGVISGSSLKITGVSELDGNAHIGGFIDIDGNVTTGGTIRASGTSSEVIDLSGSSISAIDFAIGSKVLGQSVFDNLVGLDQLLDTAQTPSFDRVQSTQASPTPPFIVASTGTVVNFSADRLDGKHAPNGLIVGDTDLQTLTNKTLTTPTIGDYTSGTHDHADAAGGGALDINQGAGGATSAEVADLMMFGAANSAFVPCIPGNSNPHGIYDYDPIGGGESNVDGTDGDIIYYLPLPTVKGTLSLFIKDVRLNIFDADSSNYVDELTLYASRFNSLANFIADSTNRSGAGTFTYTNASADDVSGHTRVFVKVDIIVGVTPSDLDIRGVEVECYYA